ncbi:MAG: Lar family restriction alleviation protein [Firmicutes bacterium]|nr:Lar family restriction alleviation protein [Candidatus Caballimonas caccae]
MEMKPCPFCGSEKLKIDSKTKTGLDCNWNSVTIYSYSVRCNKCHARGPIYTNKKDRQCNEYIYKSKQEWIDEAIKLWNNRGE